MKKIFLSEQNQNNRGEKNSPPKKSFKIYKNNLFHSLNDVEHFLNNFQYYSKYFKLYKIIKK